MKTPEEFADEMAAVQESGERGSLWRRRRRAVEERDRFWIADFQAERDRLTSERDTALREAEEARAGAVEATERWHKARRDLAAARELLKRSRDAAGCPLFLRAEIDAFLASPAPGPGAEPTTKKARSK